MPTETTNGRKAYYTTSETARMCRVHRNTIIGAIRSGKLRANRTPGGHARIPVASIEEYEREGHEVDWSAVDGEDVTFSQLIREGRFDEARALIDQAEADAALDTAEAS